jgi:hypothetical protein
MNARTELTGKAAEIVRTARTYVELRTRMNGDRPSYDKSKIPGEFRAQKAALTRAVNSKDPNQVVLTCKKTVDKWNEWGAWPDDWARWQRALDDALGYGNTLRLEDL